ncbi:hypothetical protein [Nocardia arthritidis]|uniref:hypothetical protein n=1 Tax=Nocardia arthritidis TaxID=228602 RepID=UPI0007A42039|nr:hypothetical protein [Nocardia arthritidis]
MEHGQQTGESIGAMLSSIASALREVSDKLDAVAARIDGAQTVVSEPTAEGRLAKLEAWAFRAGQDISGLDARMQRLESGDDPAPEDRTAAAQRPAGSLPRAAAGRANARKAEHGGAEPVARNSDAGEAAVSRNGARPQSTPREPVHAAAEPNSAAQTGFTPPREPTPTALDPTPALSFTAPREPASNFTAPPSREPAFTTPTPREPVAAFTPPAPRDPSTGQRETHEPATSTAAYSPGENAAYESIVAPTPSTRHSGSENGATPGTGLTGAHRAGEDDRTAVENTHVDKLQAMLDELKRTAAAPLGRSDLFDSTSNGYPSERTEAQRRPADYRLSSPPPVS